MIRIRPETWIRISVTFWFVRAMFVPVGSSACLWAFYKPSGWSLAVCALLGVLWLVTKFLEDRVEEIDIRLEERRERWHGREGQDTSGR